MTKEIKTVVRDFEGGVIKEINYAKTDIGTKKVTKNEYFERVVLPFEKLKKATKKLRVSDKLKKTLLTNDLLSITKYINDYNLTLNEVKKGLLAYNENPNIKSINKISENVREFKEAKKEAESNIWYQITYNELNEQNQIQAKELQKLKAKIQNQKNIVEMANFIVSKHKAPVTQKTKTKPITLSPNFDDFNGQTKAICNLTASLFVSSLEQWQNLFSNDIQVFKIPIELKSNTTISDLRLFLDTLYHKGLIKKQRFNKILENVKAFSYEGKALEARQYKNGRQIENYPNTKNSIKVSEIFAALNLDD